MKFIIASCFLAVVALTSAQMSNDAEALKKYNTALADCGKELSVDVSPFEAGKNPVDFDKMKEPQFKCLPKCMMLKYGAIDEAGTMQEAKIREMVPGMPADVEAKIKECVDAHTEADLCERYMNMQNCIVDKVRS